MLKFFLDEQISVKVAVGLRLHHPSLIVQSVHEWKGGALLGQSDETCLAEASSHGFTFVTYDQKTIRPMIKIWSEMGQHHAGVVFIDERTIGSWNFGEMIRALGRLADDAAELSWHDRIVHLERA